MKDGTRPITVAFDVDGCLIDWNNKDYPQGQPRDPVVTMLNQFLRLGVRVIVWSGGGQGYAADTGRRLFLPPTVEYRYKPRGGYQLGAIDVDIAFDDEDVLLGDVNVKV